MAHGNQVRYSLDLWRMTAPPFMLLKWQSGLKRYIHVPFLGPRVGSEDIVFHSLSGPVSMNIIPEAGTWQLG
jgi:hypothetical protein